MLLIAPTTFTDRVNEHIDASVAAQQVPPDQLANYLQSVSQSGATNLSPVQPFDLDGASGVYITYDLSAADSTNKAEDIVVDHGNETYDVVLNTSATDFDQQLPAMQSVLEGWKWTH